MEGKGREERRGMGWKMRGVGDRRKGKGGRGEGLREVHVNGLRGMDGLILSVYLCVFMWTYMYACTRERKRECVCTYMYAYMCVYVCVCVDVGMCVMCVHKCTCNGQQKCHQLPMCMHAHTHTHIHTHCIHETHTYMHTYTHICVHTHTHTHTVYTKHTYMYMHTYTHTHTCTHSHTLTHTHTHTHGSDDVRGSGEGEEDTTGCGRDLSQEDEGGHSPHLRPSGRERAMDPAEQGVRAADNAAGRGCPPGHSLPLLLRTLQPGVQKSPGERLGEAAAEAQDPFHRGPQHHHLAGGRGHCGGVEPPRVA